MEAVHTGCRGRCRCRFAAFNAALWITKSARAQGSTVVESSGIVNAGMLKLVFYFLSAQGIASTAAIGTVIVCRVLQ